MAAISSILAGVGAAAGIGSAVTGARAARDQTRLQQQALAQSRTELGPVSYNGFGGIQGGFNPTTGALEFGAGGLTSVRDALSRYATESVPGSGTQLPPDLLAALSRVNGAAQGPDLGLAGLASLEGAVGGQFDQANQALTQMGQQGFQRPLQNTAFSGAAQQLGEAGRGFGDVFNSTLSNLRQQAQPFEERQFNSLQNSQFATGRLGTSGGALQTEAFARGLGQADLQRQLSAQGEARATQQNALGIGQGLAGIGQGLAGQENDLLSSAFSRFGQTAGLASDLNRERFSRSAYGNQTNFDRSQSLFGNQITAAQLPAQLQGLNLQNVLSALSGQAGVQTQSLQAFQAALAASQSAANARIGAGSNAAAIVGNPNFAASGYGTSNALAQIADRFSPQSGAGGLFAGLFGGRSTEFGAGSQDGLGIDLGSLLSRRFGG